MNSNILGPALRTGEYGLKPSQQFRPRAEWLYSAIQGQPNRFRRAVDQVATAARELLDSLVTNTPPRDRDVEAAKARARTADRFRSSDTGRAN